MMRCGDCYGGYPGDIAGTELPADMVAAGTCPDCGCNGTTHASIADLHASDDPVTMLALAAGQPVTCNCCGDCYTLRGDIE